MPEFEVSKTSLKVELSGNRNNVKLKKYIQFKSFFFHFDFACFCVLLMLTLKLCSRVNAHFAKFCTDFGKIIFKVNTTGTVGAHFI